MDKTKVYIKMSKEAKEIQKLWKPEIGDFHTCGCSTCIGLKRIRIHVIQNYEKDALDNRDLQNIYDAYAEMVKFCGRDFVAHFNETRETVIWLPKQDQLQKMIKDIDDGLPHTFYRYTFMQERFEIDYYEKFKTHEQLWLAFVMKIKYNKIWTGRKWLKN